MSRKAQITDAAIATLAGAGLRGLTHRAVDRAAGLPEGSSSYYFRTRAALLQATVQRLAELDTAGLPAPRAHDLDTFCRDAAALIHRWMTTDRHRQIARYELALEATRRPELRATLVRGGVGIRATLAELLTAAGVDAPHDSAHDLAAFLDGLLFDQIAGAGDRTLTLDDLTTTLRALMTAIAK